MTGTRQRWRAGTARAAGHDIYVLDDSRAPAPLSADIAAAVVHVRREGRHGAKGGNLNHWVNAFGDRYEQFVILDADSVMTADSIVSLMRAAAHPANRARAVFQTKTAPRLDSQSSLYARMSGLGARSRCRVFERVHARLGLVLSFGHNQLVRLSALKAVGGFDEELTAEDTVLSLRLAAIGYETALVNVWTLEREPETLARGMDGQRGGLGRRWNCFDTPGEKCRLHLPS